MLGLRPDPVKSWSPSTPPWLRGCRLDLRVGRSFPDDPKAWTVVNRSYVFRRPPWLVVREERLRLPSGGEIPDYWIHEYPEWVTVVAVTADERVVLLRQYRPGIAAVHFEIPGGVVDATDVSMEAAARRELLEETGFGGGVWAPLITLSANSATTTNLTHSFLALGVRQEREPSPESTEDLRVHQVPVGDVAGIIAAGDVVQALHAAALYSFLLRR